MTTARLAAKPQRRAAAAQGTREAILRAATTVFARYGYDGGTVEKISRAARSVDRMIYYYFGSKEGLFVAVLEEMYRAMDRAEAALVLDAERPVQTLEAVIRFVHGYYRAHPEFVTLLNAENLHQGRHIGKSLRAGEYSSHAIDVIRQVLASGIERGLFRSDVAAREVYLLIAATGYFYMSNRHTLSAFLGEPLETAQAVARWESFAIDTVLRAVSAAPATTILSN